MKEELCPFEVWFVYKHTDIPCVKHAMVKPINFVQTEALFIADKKEFCLNVNILKYFF